MNDRQSRARLALIGSMCIWGTIGLVRRFLPVPSGFLSMTRGIFGAAFLLGGSLLLEDAALLGVGFQVGLDLLHGVAGHDALEGVAVHGLVL